MKRWRSLSVFVLALTAVYLYALPTATISYAITVLLHTGVGVLLVLGLAVLFVRGFSRERLLERFGWLLLSAGGALGVALIYLGTPHRMRMWLYSHIAISTLGTLLLVASWMAEHGRLGVGPLERLIRSAVLLVATVGIAAGAWWVRTVAWTGGFRIQNPPLAPAMMDNEGDGPQGKFFPSSVQT